MRIGTKEVEFPLIQGGMGIGVSMGRLAGHVASQGAIGIISAVNAGYREPDFETNTREANLRALKKEIAIAREIAGGRGLVGVNIMTAVTNYEAACRCAAEAGADLIISGAGLPLKLPEYVQGTDTLCAPVVSSGRAASILIRQYQKNYQRKPDLLILEGHMAGGHLGFSKEDLAGHTCKDNHTLLQEVKAAAGDIPVFVAGGVYDGRDMAAFVREGAAGVQIGTRFIATRECDASDRFKQAIVDAKEEDIRIIVSPVGMPARAIMSPMLERLKAGVSYPAIRCVNCLSACKKKDAPYCISRALIEAVRGNWEDGLFFTGQNAYRIDRITSVAELIGEIRSEFEENR